jgi:hypothetical protein
LNIEAELKTNAGQILTAVQRQIKQVQTASLDLSFNELMDMYTSPDKELTIDPDYQRTFRWSAAKESRFIESLILGMPIPPIFVIELADSKYELIDGLQRLSSYFHFRGRLRLEDPDRPIRDGDALTLSDCDIVEELNGMRHDDLPPAIQIRLKRHFIRVEVIRKDSDQRLRYHMFKRLNTGGENLSEQEIRNCTLRMLEAGAQLMKFLIELSLLPDFKLCTESLSDDAKQKRFDQELVLRFFALKNNRQDFTHDVTDFLTDYAETIAEPAKGRVFDYEAERRVFLKTFSLLAKSLEEKAFGWVNNRGRIVKGFSVYHFEALTLGIQPCLEKFNEADNASIERLKKEFESIKADQAFRDITTGGGKNSSGALQERVVFVERRLAQIP